ncbi:undecaprenyl-phosphate glucose phosphotransferase [Halomonas sabkhae]|uniref:undecaprenyl-phosphate glucose phosphotransferase n=1 Tax=Halomonas sabkhae TaxID=626223 RepID=UPI0025B33412|nr:undecaprenyl-phosphate glucose phosphotransferase [Halomonas sabkhae]MDN3524158.1 undecaprenyl-phosphate glucose phosphotransferase [Halomonas sabkhae]
MSVSGTDWLRRLMRCFDAMIAIMASVATLLVMSRLEYTDGLDYPLLILAGSLLLPACGEMVGLYQPWRGRSLFTMLGIYALSWLLTIILLSVFLVATQRGIVFSRAWMLISAIAVLLLGCLLRAGLYAYLRVLRARGRNIKRVLVIGKAANIERVRERLDGLPYIGYRLCDVLVDSPDEDISERVRTLAEQSMFRRDYDEIWLTYPLSDGEAVKQIASSLLAVPVNLRYFPDLSDVRLLNHRVAQVADMYSLDLNVSPLNGPVRVVKALEDRILGMALFLFFLPVMLIVAGLVRWQMGAPVLFKQYRHGLDGKRFRIYKFRTMSAGPEAGATRQASAGDSRITPLGAFLRRTSLDELPQLYNVLQGRMSLVGPRPHAMDHNNHYKDVIEAYMQRHRVKPGMTGWAQVNGLRGITDDVALMRRRVEYDLYYIDNWSPGLDFKILLMTVPRGFVNRQP